MVDNSLSSGLLPQPTPARTICIHVAQRHRGRLSGRRAGPARRARGQGQLKGAQLHAQALHGIQAALEQRGAERQARAARPQQRPLTPAALR